MFWDLLFIYIIYRLLFSLRLTSLSYKMEEIQNGFLGGNIKMGNRKHNSGHPGTNRNYAGNHCRTKMKEYCLNHSPYLLSAFLLLSTPHAMFPSLYISQSYHHGEDN